MSLPSGPFAIINVAISVGHFSFAIGLLIAEASLIPVPILVLIDTFSTLAVSLYTAIFFLPFLIQ